MNARGGAEWEETRVEKTFAPSQCEREGPTSESAVGGMTGRNVRWTFLPVSFSTLVSGNGANREGSPDRNSDHFLPVQTESGGPGRNSDHFLSVQTKSGSPGRNSGRFLPTQTESRGSGNRGAVEG